MSGSTIGGVVGAAVGFWVSGFNPEGLRWGWMVGSTIGGIVSPDTINAPGIGDAQKQTSAAGVPRPVVYGHPAPFMGNVIDGEKRARKITRKTQQGKGGGPEVKEERFILTSAIRICEGPIAGVLRIWRNGEVVYDRRTVDDFPVYEGGSLGDRLGYIVAVRAKTTSFAAKVRIYLGTETQLPDPALEAIHGVGNTPYYRGTAYIVIEDDDVTDSRGACAQYQFEVLAAATAGVEDDTSYLPARWSEFTNSHWPLSDTSPDYLYTGTQTLANGTGLSYSAATIQGVLDYFAANNGYGIPQNTYIGYSNAQNLSAIGNKGFDITADLPSVINNEKLTLLYNAVEPEQWFPGEGATGDTCITIPSSTGIWYGLFDGSIVRRGPLGALRGYYSCDDTTLAGLPPIVITVERKLIAPEEGGLLPIPDAPGYSVDADGNPVQDKQYTFLTGTFKQLGIDVTRTISGESPGIAEFVYYRTGPSLPLGDPDYNNATFWTAAYDAAVAEGKIASGLTYNAAGGPGHYPQTVTEAYQAGQPFNTLAGTNVTLRSVVEDIASRCKLPATRLNASALGSDIIPGLLVAQQFTGADCLRPTQQMFFYDLPDIDGRLVAVKRGSPAVLTVTDDDLLEDEGEDKTTIPQELEFPLKVSVVTQDPAADYAAVPQTSERYAPGVKPTSEIQIPSPIPFGAGLAKAKAITLHKVLWAQAQGRDEYSLPEEFSRLVPSDAVERNGKRWLIEDKSGSDGAYRLKLVYDPASAYTTVATGVGATPPGLPSSGLRGPTRFVAMNLPQLRAQDNTPGMYVAAHGMLAGWPGADLLLSVDGGLTFQNVLTMTNAAVIGELTAGITSSGTPLSVRVYGELESVTADQITARANAFAIGSFPIEVGQFQTATLTAAGSIANNYNLTVLSRGQLETAEDAHNIGERFVLLDDAVYFVPIDTTHAGKTLIFRAVTRGTVAENNPTFPVVYEPPTYVLDGGGA